MKGPLSAAWDEVRRELQKLLGTEKDDGRLTAGEALDKFYRATGETWRKGAKELDHADSEGAAAVARSAPDWAGSTARSGESAVPLAEIRPAGVSRLIRNAHQLTAVEEDAMRRAYAAQATLLSRIDDRPPTSAEVRELLLLVNPTRSRTAGNCMECSWAVRDILAGRPAVAGPSGAQKFIEPSTERFHGDSHREIHEAISERLYRPGQNAIMSGNRYSDAFGHHYNVANIDGTIYYLDGQTGTMTDENIVPDGDYYVVFPMRDNNA
ncbi:toxin glutamine deamidase domain-containing protein [Nocardia gipuzkoensis]|uniref:toxin glutamine deamidase domain-containing protein n=1 Tax=Nocardia gipuzkoensis TaxID=2749991 RepID=UPI0015EF6BDC|nr:toxin glutamine deamidase domain-containing protein [Nocardia gipuzkoensis]